MKIEQSMSRRKVLKMSAALGSAAAFLGKPDRGRGKRSQPSSKRPRRKARSPYTARPRPARLTQSLRPSRKSTGINVSVYRAGSADVATRVQSEESAGRVQADTLIIEEPALSLLLPFLASYDLPERASVDAPYKGPQYTLIRMYMAQLGWNANTVKGPAAPTDWKDLLDPKWKGRFGSLDPHVTATTLAWQVMVDQLYGPSYLQAFGANQPKLYASTNAMSQAIVAGEIDLGVTNSFGVIQMADTGAPLAGIVPKNTVLFGGNVSVFSKAPHRMPRACSVTLPARLKVRPSSTLQARPSQRTRMPRCQRRDLWSLTEQGPYLQPAGLQVDNRRHPEAACRMGQARKVTSCEDSTRRPGAGGIGWEHFSLSLIAAAAIVMVFYPILFVFLRSISKDNIGGELTIEWLSELVNSSRSHEALVNTSIYSAGSSLLAMILGVSLSFLCTRTDMPGSRLIAGLALLPMLLPPFILSSVGWRWRIRAQA